MPLTFDRRALGALAVALGIALVGWAALAPRATDEDAIAALLERVAKSARVDGEAAANPVVHAARLADEYKTIFAKDVSVRIPELAGTISDRRTLAQVATRAHSELRRLDVSFSAIDVRLHETKDVADVALVADVEATWASGRTERDERKVALRLAKYEGAWLVATLSVAEKPPAAPR